MSNQETKKTKKKVVAVPWIAQLYLSIYDNLPPIYAPFLYINNINTNNNNNNKNSKERLNISFTLFSSLCLILCKYSAEYALIHLGGWPNTAAGTTEDRTAAIATLEAAASCASICHSTVLCLGLLVAFRTQTYDVVATLAEQQQPTWWPRLADALLQLCGGYMLYDAGINIFYLRYAPNTTTGVVPFQLNDDDILFLLHHFVTSFYMLSARCLGAGYQSAMICMFLGELTNPLQNLRWIGIQAQTIGGNGVWYGTSARGLALHATINVGFALAYFVIRVVIAPPFFAHTSYQLLGTSKGRTNIQPLPLNLFWNFCIWAVCFGSTSWILKCYHILVETFAPQHSHPEL